MVNDRIAGEQSHFGIGFVYNIGLFLAHEYRINEYLKSMKGVGSDENRAYELFFYGAADHLFELQWDQAPTNELKERAKKFKDFCVDRRLSQPTKEDFNWAIDEAKEILREVDKYLCIDSEKAQWE